MSAQIKWSAQSLWSQKQNILGAPHHFVLSNRTDLLCHYSLMVQTAIFSLSQVCSPAATIIYVSGNTRPQGVALQIICSKLALWALVLKLNCFILFFVFFSKMRMFKHSMSAACYCKEAFFPLRPVTGLSPSICDLAHSSWWMFKSNASGTLMCQTLVSQSAERSFAIALHAEMHWCHIVAWVCWAKIYTFFNNNDWIKQKIIQMRTKHGVWLTVRGYKIHVGRVKYVHV